MVDTLPSLDFTQLRRIADAQVDHHGNSVYPFAGAELVVTTEGAWILSKFPKLINLLAKDYPWYWPKQSGRNAHVYPERRVATDLTPLGVVVKQLHPSKGNDQLFLNGIDQLRAMQDLAELGVLTQRLLFATPECLVSERVNVSRADDSDTFKDYRLLVQDKGFKLRSRESHPWDKVWIVDPACINYSRRNLQNPNELQRYLAFDPVTTTYDAPQDSN